jgi:predicted RNase H-like nuclease (RuvC/YqgF family)
MTPNHVCEQATQKMIDEIKKMGDPGRNTGMADILRKHITDLAVDLQEKERENNQLRAELDRIRKMDDKAFANWREREASLLKEIECLRLTLTAERKEREEAEMKRDNYLHCLNGSTKAKYTAEIYDREVKRADEAEAQVEVLMESLQHIMEDHCEDVSGCSCCKYDVATAKNALANLPVRADAVEKVLDAADKWYDEWKDYGAMSLSYIELRDAIRERREK